MKNKIILFGMGVLVGLILATGSFYIYTLMQSRSETSSNTSLMEKGSFPRKERGYDEKRDGERNKKYDKNNTESVETGN